MENQTYSTAYSTSNAVSSLFKSVYLQMAAALAITGLTAWVVANNTSILSAIYGNPASVWIILGVQIGLVIWLSARVWKMSMTTATILFTLYSIVTGVSLSLIFLIYDLGTISAAFFTTAGTFLAMSLIGYTTKMNLAKVGSVLYMLLIGLIIATVVNIFLASSSLYWIITYAGVGIFTGLMAYDTYRLRQIFTQYGQVDEMGQKLALMGAFTLYLDFINLFLYLLRIFGSSRD
ncbi:MAG: Bax inhibitor-1/YccA family protein [Alistipes sp.]|nr:Bax inhibitor-1/YccA family protein [Alistipes sp.]